MATTDGPGSFRSLLQRYRLAAGLSQEELAERAGLSRRGISDLERGARRSPHPATVRRLTQALNLADGQRAALLASAHAAPATEMVGPLAGLVPSSVGVNAHLGHNLPAPLTSFIGRWRELEELPRVLATARLLTVTAQAVSARRAWRWRSAAR